MASSKDLPIYASTSFFFNDAGLDAFGCSPANGEKKTDKDCDK